MAGRSPVPVFRGAGRPLPPRGRAGCRWGSGARCADRASDGPRGGPTPYRSADRRHRAAAGPCHGRDRGHADRRCPAAHRCRASGSALSAPLGTLLIGVGVGEPPRRPVRLRGTLGRRAHVREPLRLPGRDLLQPQRQLKGARPVLRILRQTGPHQRGQRVRHTVQLRLLVDDAVQHHLGTAVPEGRVTHRRVRERGAQREHVRGRGDGGAAHLLGGEEARRADRRADVGEGRGPRGPGDAEVDDPRPLGGQQDVGRLQIPVHDTGLVDGDQPLAQGGPYGGDLRGAQRALVGDLVVQGGAGHVLRGEPGALGLEIGGHQPGRAATADPPCRRDLTREARAELLILRQIGPDHLECDPLPLLVGAQVDDAHAARAEPSVKPERADDARVLAPQAHHRHVHPRCPVRLTSHSLRFRGPPCAEAAPSRPDGLSVAGGRLEGWSEGGRTGRLSSEGAPNHP